MDFFLNNKEKYFWNEIWLQFIQPNFSITDYVIVFEFDDISRRYRFVVTPLGDQSRFISLYLLQHDKIDAMEMEIISTHIDEFNAPNNEKIRYLLLHDDAKRFNRFYQGFIDELKLKNLKATPTDFFNPNQFRMRPFSGLRDQDS